MYSRFIVCSKILICHRLLRAKVNDIDNNEISNECRFTVLHQVGYPIYPIPTQSTVSIRSGRIGLAIIAFVEGLIQSNCFGFVSVSACMLLRVGFVNPLFFKRIYTILFKREKNYLPYILTYTIKLIQSYR